MKKFFYAGCMLSILTITSVNSIQAQTKIKQETKTGWSHKKKDAAIGAGAGAVTGAVISKNHGTGAVVGGIVGAGAGYIYGRHKDKKNPTRKKVYKTKKTVE